MSIPLLLLAFWAAPALVLTAWTTYAWFQLARRPLDSAVNALVSTHPLCSGCLATSAKDEQGQPGPWQVTKRPQDVAVIATFGIGLCPAINFTMLLLLAGLYTFLVLNAWADARRTGRALALQKVHQTQQA